MRLIFLCLFILLGKPSLTFGGAFDDLIRKNGLFYESWSDVPFTGEITGIDRGAFKDGLRHGRWVQGHENGQVKSEGDYENGLKQGQWIGYYKNGQIFYEGAYVDGIKDGLWVSFYDDGKIFYRGQYKKGKEDGAWLGFNPDGTPWPYRTGIYKDGVRVDK